MLGSYLLFRYQTLRHMGCIRIGKGIRKAVRTLGAGSSFRENTTLEKQYSFRGDAALDGIFDKTIY